jgi:hypothetical protein
MSIPILGYGLYWTSKRFVHDMKDAEVYEYYKKRIRFDKDIYLVERLMKNRMNLMKE